MPDRSNGDEGRKFIDVFIDRILDDAGDAIGRRKVSYAEAARIITKIDGKELQKILSKRKSCGPDVAARIAINLGIRLGFQLDGKAAVVATGLRHRGAYKAAA
jgi:hypothetical protein